VRYHFVRTHASQFPIRLLCRLMRVSAAGYYAWRGRPESRRQQANRDLVEEIKRVQAQSRGTYGRRRVYAQLQAQGGSCSRHRVARLMRQEGLCGRLPRCRWRLIGWLKGWS
jgi:putative transposase